MYLERVINRVKAGTRILERRNRVSTVGQIVSNSIRGAALLCALTLLPLNGTVSANEATPVAFSQDKDLKEAWEKLQAEVKAGKITQEEAKKKMAELKKKHGLKKKKGPSLEDEIKKLKAAVKEGKITKEEAKKKMAELKKKHAKKKKEHDLKELWKKLQKAVKEGKMTEEEAKKKMAEAKKKAEMKKKKSLKKKSSN